MVIIRFILAFVAAFFGILLAVPIIAIGFPFWAVAVLTRTFSRPLESRVMLWQQIIEYYPTLGWKHRANLNAYALSQNGEVFQFSTDAQGWRGKANIEESKVLVFGDSFAFGFGINDNEFFAELNPTVRVKSIGANGYNMVQSLLWMQRLSWQMRGKLVIWFIFYGNDLYENLVPNLCQYRMPFVKKVNGTGNWEIVMSHVRPDRWLYTSEPQNDNRLAEICCPTFLSQRVFSACEFLIEKARDICNDAGAQLVIMGIPEALQIRQSGVKFLASLVQDPKSFDPDLPDKKISEICNKLVVPFVALKNHLKESDYLVGDVHWNKKGNQRIAEVLYGLYQDYFKNSVNLKMKAYLPANF